MNSSVRSIQVERLRSRLEKGEQLDYPQATADVRAALIELDHFKGDAEFLREEKRLAWKDVLDGPERYSAIAASWLFILGLVIGAAVALTIYLGRGM